MCMPPYHFDTFCRWRSSLQSAPAVFGLDCLYFQQFQLDKGKWKTALNETASNAACEKT